MNGRAGQSVDPMMEYHGATRTGIGALKHELVPMCFGTSVLNRTWRDTWFDESAVQWWLAWDRLPTLPPGFTSNLARGRSQVAPGFDEAAYGTGGAPTDRSRRTISSTMWSRRRT